jgi:hypothetical protein
MKITAEVDYDPGIFQFVFQLRTAQITGASVIEDFDAKMG